MLSEGDVDLERCIASDRIIWRRRIIADLGLQDEFIIGVKLID